MNRRRFLTFSAALAASGWPLSLGCNLGSLGSGNGDPDEIPPVDQDDPLASSLARAERLGKPLLVLVVPEDDHEQWERGQLLGSLLNKGDRQVLVDLALCEVLCASTDEIKKHISDAGLEHDPYLLLVETGMEPRACTPICGELPPVRDDDWQTDEDEQADSMRERLELLAAWLHEAVAAGEKDVTRRAAQSRTSLSANESKRLDEDSDVALVDLEFVDRAAGALLGLAGEGRLSKEAAHERLAEAAAARLRVVPPHGAKWANSTGCGTEIEGEHGGMMVACGMGHVPEIGRRFLSFYV